MYIKIDGAKLQDFAQKKIILFGASSTGVKALEEFQWIQADILGFCDNSPEKQGTIFEGYPVYSPNQLFQICQTDKSISVMITSIYEKEISKQLTELGVDNQHIVHMGVLYEKLEFKEFGNPILAKAHANEVIRERIKQSAPFFIGRIGSTELELICNYKYFTNRINCSGVPYTKNITNMLCDWCGFFPAQNDLMDKFCELYLHLMPTADLLWCMWQSKFEDKLYRECCPGTELTLYDDTGFPLDVECPWTGALVGKKVLVIHPFEDSIRTNYQIKNKLFDNQNFLPDFELITMKAVQTIADNKVIPWQTWFEALESMKEQMRCIDFDVALIGAGAYGFPLAAYAKKLGKQGVHIGGMLQLYFGIRGKYYDQFGYHNEYWTRPLEAERPRGFEKVEAGRYW